MEKISYHSMLIHYTLESDELIILRGFLDPNLKDSIEKDNHASIK